MNLTSPAVSRIAGRLWAIAPTRLEALVASATAINGGNDLLSWLQAARPRDYAVSEGGIAVVPVLGPLVSRGDWLTTLLGASEYGAVADALAAAADDPAVRGIVLEVDSPGGEVGGLFDLVETIGSIKAQSAKPLWAVASEAALSAAYAIASVADRLYATRTGEVGSVGVVAVHLDESGADAMAGLKWTLIHAGARKTDGNPHEPLSPRATADIQSDVDALYDQLVALVAGNRGLGADTVRATEAAIYRGEKAVKAGLADRVGTVPQAIADLEAAMEAKRIRAGPTANRPAVRQSPPPARTFVMNNPNPLMEETGAAPPNDAGDTDINSDLPEVPPDTTPPDRPSPAPVPDAHAIADRLRGEFSEIATVAAQAARLGLDIDAADAMRRGLKPDALRRTILDKLAARSEAADVVAIAPPPATTGDSPIVRRARERAAARKEI
ncbi:MAG: S49 family peptidase [Rhodospirillales bacterium]|nr:S49 family peptidase [Rhodospirillales bacterium]